MNKILAGLQIIAKYDEDFETCAEHDVFYAGNRGPSSGFKSKDDDEEPVTNCADCDVEFDDYPEMRTDGPKCSTCDKGPSGSPYSEEAVPEDTLMSGEDSKSMDELNWAWNGESWEHFT